IVRRMRTKGRVLVAQHGVGLPSGVDLSSYDFGVSMLPSVLERFQQYGLPSYKVHLAFEPSVLDRLGAAPKKDIAISFVGSVAGDHARRVKLLEAIATRVPIGLWLSDIRGLPARSPLRKHYRGTAWGQEMYDVIRRSKITLNCHIDSAGGVA